MIRLGMTVVVPVLKEENVRKVIQEFTKLYMREAVRRFLDVTLNMIPVRTGFLRGSFAPIAKNFGATGTGVGRGFQGVKNERYYHSSGGGGILKTPTSGQQFSIPVAEVLKSDRVGGFTFNFGSQIKYYGVNDYGSRTRGTPWGSIDTGIAVMSEFLSQIDRVFPKIDKILSELTITVSGSSMRETVIEPDIDGVIRTASLFL